VDVLQWTLIGLAFTGFALLWNGFAIMEREVPSRDAHPNQQVGLRTKQQQFQQDVQLLYPGRTVWHVRERQLRLGLLAWMAGLPLGLLTWQPGWFLIAFLLAVLLYAWPERQIRKKAREWREAWHEAFPLLYLGVMQRMSAGVSPVQALIQSRERIDPSIRPQWDRFIMDIRMSGDPVTSWRRWSERIGSPQARRFAALMQQIMTINGVDMERQLRAAYQLLRKEQQEAWSRKVRQLPGRLQWPNLILFANLILLPVIGVGMELSQHLRIFL